MGPLIGGIVWVVSSIIGHEEIWCENEFTPAASNFMCGTQGILVYLSTLYIFLCFGELTNSSPTNPQSAFFLQIALMIATFYWFFIALTLFLLIALEVNIDHYPWYKYIVHSISLSAPVAIAIVLFAVQDYGGGGLGKIRSFHSVATS